MKYVNYTPHKIVIQLDDETIVVEPSGTVARVESIEKELTTLGGVPIITRAFGAVEGLPECNQIPASHETPERVKVGGGFHSAGIPAERTTYIVSAMVLAALPYRFDVAAPDTGTSAIRNEAGQIVAVRRLIMNECALIENGDCAF